MRRLAVSDIHGNLEALKSALRHAKFNPQMDHLFFVGDYIDRHPYTKEVVDYVLQVPHKTCIRGNHDQFMIDHLKQPGPERPLSAVWKDNGAEATLKSYGLLMKRINQGKISVTGDIPETHVEFYNSLKPWHVTSDGIAFVHGGFDLELKDMSVNFVIWDRLMWRTAIEDHAHGYTDHPCFKRYEKIFIGHTNLLNYPGQEECLPQKRLNVWNIDTGAGFTGPLTVMDIDTEEFWQSETY